MGAYFNTCLSPGDFNYFSVFANAADVNKKVLYARDERDVVVGRCLLALCDAGGILVFRAYCHDSRAGFQAYVNGFAVDLANRMRTMVVDRGKVSSLVAPEWYDDGPVDLCDRFPFLSEGSPFRLALQSVHVNDLRELVSSVFEPVGVNGLTLALVLRLAEFDARPELVLPFRQDIEAVAGFPTELWRQVVHRFHRAGAGDFARQLVQRRLVPAILKQQWLSSEFGLTIAEVDPSAAVRLIQQTRANGIRRDEDENDDERREILATAYRLLGRQKKARTMMPKQASG
jgi:hypothetical protein